MGGTPYRASVTESRNRTSQTPSITHPHHDMVLLQCQGLRQALEAQSSSLIRLQETDRELRREAQDLHKALEMRKMDLGYLQNEVRDARTRADDRSRALEISEMKVQTLEHKVGLEKSTYHTLALGAVYEIEIVHISLRYSSSI